MTLRPTNTPRHKHTTRLQLSPIVSYAIIGSLVVGAASMSLDSILLGTTPTAHAYAINDNAIRSASLGLDKTGQTIPDTNYAIPEGAVFMATTGDDTNAGTVDAPVKTLNRAVDLVPPLPGRGTVVIRGGVYRDWYYKTPNVSGAIIYKDVSFQAYPHEKVWFDGTDVIASSAWKNNNNGTWSMSWSTPSFCDNKYYTRSITAQAPLPANNGPCYHYDMSQHPSYPRAGDPQMVYINGSRLQQVGALSQIANNAGKFYYDHTARVMYIGTSPVGKTVELAARPNALVLGATPSSSSILGIGFRRYATNEYGILTRGAVYLGGESSATTPQARVENSVFTQNAAYGLNMRPNGIVRHNVFAQNGYTGMTSNGHGLYNNYAMKDKLLIENNLVAGNNIEHFGYNCKASCGMAGIKIAHMNGFTVRGNIFEGNLEGAAGFWCDLNCRDGVIVNNVARNNQGSGLFYEVSSNGIIASNLIYSNGKQGIRVASDTTKIYNNTLVKNGGMAIWVYDDNRNAQVTNGTEPVLDTRNIEVYNNVVYATAGNAVFLAQKGSPTSPLNTNPNVYMKGLDYNSYFRTTTAIPVTWWDASSNGGKYTYLSTFRLTHKAFEGHSHDLRGSSTTNPFFISLTGSDFRIRSGTPAYNSARVVSADVASAMGIPAGTVTSRGALAWPRY